MLTSVITPKIKNWAFDTQIKCSYNVSVGLFEIGYADFNETLYLTRRIPEWYIVDPSGQKIARP